MYGTTLTLLEFVPCTCGSSGPRGTVLMDSTAQNLEREDSNFFPEDCIRVVDSFHVARICPVDCSISESVITDHRSVLLVARRFLRYKLRRPNTVQDSTGLYDGTDDLRAPLAPNNRKAILHRSHPKRHVAGRFINTCSIPGARRQRLPDL